MRFEKRRRMIWHAAQKIFKIWPPNRRCSGMIYLICFAGLFLSANGDFSVADGDTPTGWKGDGKIAREDRESFLRIEQNNPTGAAMVTQQVSVPEKARHIRATAKVRLKNLRMDNEFGLKPCFVADCYDKKGQQLQAV